MTKSLTLGFVTALAFAGAASAQDATVSAQASYSAPAPAASSSGGGSSDLRLVGQVRFDAINLVGELGGAGAVPVTGATPITPFFTAGIRILDTRLFIGAGLGFGGFSADTGASDVGRFNFAFTPVASYDFLSSENAALYGIGMFNLVSVGESETDGPGGSVNNNDDIFGIGLNAGVGIRGKLNEALAISTEFGWGFSSLGGAADSFDHGLWGTVVFEASTGL